MTRQGYDAWRARQAAPPSARQVETELLVAAIRAIHAKHRGRYGAPRVFVELRVAAIRAIHAKHRGRYGAPRVFVELRRAGWRVGMSRVARLMAAEGLQGRCGRRGLPRTTIADPSAAPVPNRLERDFRPQGPDRVGVTDITYLLLLEGRWCYLDAIVDCYSRMVVGWALAEHMRTELCEAAPADAVARRRPAPGLIHHSVRTY